jgi:iron complex outermembrane receptor protein
MHPLRRLGLAGVVAGLLTGSGTAAAAAGPPPLAQWSLEELMQVEVRLVSRQPLAAVDSPAALYVLSGDDLRRTGAITLADALRLVPGMQVTRIDASKWGVTARGFNDLFANKLLVLVDGRTVYNPLFSGVFWEVQELLLDDVERIEVIRGPGAAMWGSNAMNGVINVITRRAGAEDGIRLRLGGGTGAERGFLHMAVDRPAPGGGRLRLTGTRYLGGATPAATGVQGADDWRILRGGVRADWQRGTDEWMLSTEGYGGEAGQTFVYVTSLEQPAITSQATRSTLEGGHVLGRWRRARGAGGESVLQLYYDYLSRDDLPVGGAIHTVDVDAQMRLPPWHGHEAMLGAGYRMHRDDFDGSFAFTLEPERRSLHLFSLFVHDEVDLRPDLGLSLGTRLEHNSFTRFEWQPNARLLWKMAPQRTAWLSVARAVRTPSRIDEDERFIADVLGPGELFEGSPPAILELEGNGNFNAETLVAVDGGLRLQFGDKLAVDVAAFHNWYGDQRTSELTLPRAHPTQPGFLLVPILADNRSGGTAYGAEVAVDANPLRDWRLRMGYSFERMSLELDEDSTEPNDLGPESQPRHQLFLRAGWTPSRAWHVDGVLRFVDHLERHEADAYLRADLRLAWRPTDQLEITCGARDLLAGERIEYSDVTYILHATKVAPRGWASLSWNW